LTTGRNAASMKALQPFRAWFEVHLNGEVIKQEPAE
jgi:hypothetical protein